MAEIWGEGDHLQRHQAFQNSPKSWLCYSLFLEWSTMLSSFLFVRWRKEKERGYDKNKGQTLGLWEFDQSVTLVAVKDLSRCISCRDKVPLSRVTGRILSSTWSGALIFDSLGLGQESFALPWSLFSYSVHEEEGEGAHRRNALGNQSSGVWSSPRTPQKGCDTISFLWVLWASIWLDNAASLSKGFLRVHLFFLQVWEE